MADEATLKAEIESLKSEIEKAKEASLGELDANSPISQVAERTAEVYKWGPSREVNIKARKTLNGHFGKVYAMHWGMTDSHQAVSASQDGKLIVWNTLTTNKIQAIPLRSSWVMTCAFERTEGQFLACGGLDNLCSIYATSIGNSQKIHRATCELAAHDGYLSCARFVDPKTIVTSSGDGTCIQWDVDSGEALRSFSGHSNDVMSISLCPGNENLFMSGSCDATAKMWDMRDQNACVETFYGHESDINSVMFSGNGTTFGTGSDDSSCRIFDTRAHQTVNTLYNEKIVCPITSVDFSKSGRMLFGGYDDSNCYVWDTLEENRMLQTLGRHENRISCLGVSVAGDALCTGSWDNTLSIWA